MKILALVTILLSLTSGNSNFEVLQKCNKAFEYNKCDYNEVIMQKSFEMKEQ